MAVLICSIFVLISIGFGRKILQLLHIKSDNPLESSIFGLGIGLGVLSYLVLAVGLLGILYWWVIVGIAVIMAVFSIREIADILSSIVQGIRDNAKSKMQISTGMITLSAVALGSLAMIAALAPPSGLDWDGLAYHLAIPKIYLAHHKIIYVPFMSHSNFPFLTEMLYTIGLSLGSTALAKLFHFTMYIATATALYSLCRRYISPLAGGVSAILFMSIPVVLYEAGIAYADLTMGLYVTLAVYAILNWERTEQTPWIVVCGLMCGFALGTKVLAAVPIAVLCVWVLIACGRSSGWGRGFKLALMLGGVSLLVGSPWYIKSFVYTGNPVYPFLYSIFGGKYWSAQAAQAYVAEQSSFGMGKGILKALLLPWNLLVNGVYFSNQADPNRPLLFVLIGPALLGLLPVYVLTKKFNKVILKIGAVAVICLAAWFVLMQHSRYLIGFLPLFCVIAGAGVEAANGAWRFGRHVVNAFVTFCVIIGLFLSYMLAMVGANVVAGAVPQEEYLSGMLDVYDAQMLVNNSLPKDARVILFDEVRGFYLDRDYMWGNPNHHEMIPWKSFSGGKDMVRFLRKQGIDYALLNNNFANMSDDFHQKYIVDAIGRGYMREIDTIHGVGVYEFVEP